MKLLSSKQEEVLIGTILGDGYLELNGNNCRLQVLHSYKQKKYVDWKWLVFTGFVKSKPRIIGENCYRFRSVNSPIFTAYHSIFYPDGRTKIVPRIIKTLLGHPLALAILYMDDGKRRPDCRGFFLDTMAFGVKGQNRLINAIESNFGFRNLKLHWNGDGYHIYFPAENADRFVKLIKPYIIPSMRYKLPLAL
jgi:hypothetical protein